MPGPEEYGLNIRKQDGVVIVEFTDVRILDQVQIEKIKETLIRLVGAVAKPKVVMNFEGVKSISSAVIGVVIALNKACVERSGALRIAGLSPDIVTVFKLTRIDKLVRIDKSLQDSLTDF